MSSHDQKSYLDAQVNVLKTRARAVPQVPSHVGFEADVVGFTGEHDFRLEIFLPADLHGLFPEQCAIT
ncbi:MAG: hypothetical protein JRN68_03690 [Nitrososphaerota archaeon]|nr:hypothetical protein [Nitrososphaerota archaeon]